MSEEVLYLYTVLDLDESASKAEIKDSYRRLAQKHHPDKGGKEEVFLEIKVAYETLIDPQQRAKYHETGDYDEAPPPKTERGEQLVLETFSMLIQENTKGDMIVVARNMLEIALRKIISGITKFQQEKKKCNILLKRVKKLKDKNHLDDLWTQAVEAKIAGINASVEHMEGECKGVKDALKILDKYHDKEPDEVSKQSIVSVHLKMNKP